MPKRIQMRRDRPWRDDNPNAVIVSRPSKWGNPFKIGERDHNNDVIEDRDDAKRAFAAWAEDCLQPYLSHRGIFADLHELRGKDLACWCPLDQPCHADVLLEVANRPITSAPEPYVNEDEHTPNTIGSTDDEETQ